MNRIKSFTVDLRTIEKEYPDISFISLAEDISSRYAILDQCDWKINDKYLTYIQPNHIFNCRATVEEIFFISERHDLPIVKIEFQ